MKQDRDLTKLSEPFQSFVKHFLDECNREKLEVFVTEASRTTERQQELWNKGRTTPGSIVTWIDGVKTKSKHQEGQAVDIAFRGKFLYPTTPEIWDKVFDIAEKHHITSLYRKYGVDRPHLEYQGTEPYDDLQLLNYQLMQLPKEMLENIKQDYEPMTLVQMKEKAKEWMVQDDFERGLKKLTKPKDYKDFRLCIILGRN